MKTILNKLFGIREEEAFKVSLMFVFNFLIIASMMILKPMRKSLFLVNIGIEKLPYVFILVAVFAALVDMLRSRIKRFSRLNYQIPVTIIGSIVCLLAFWLPIRAGYRSNWFLYAFYIWVAIYAVIMSSQFYLFANYVYNAREAKRLFGFIGVGAISGGIFGGYLTKYFAPRLGTENLIFFCISFLLICMMLFWMVWKRSYHSIKQERIVWRSDRAKAVEKKNPVRLIFESRHLLFMTGLIAIGVIVAEIADFQYSDITSRAVTDQDGLTAFFGFWMSNVSFVALAVQLFLSGRIIRKFGVGASLFFLPLGLLAGAASILISPSLASAITIKFGDGAFKHSINKGGIELLALPIPPAVKNKVKVFIDTVIKNLATGFAGILLIVLFRIAGLSVQYISIISIAMIALWLFLIVKVKTEYVNSFRNAIEKRSIDLDEQSLNLADASVFAGLMKVLEGDNERQILYVLHLIEGVKNRELVPTIEKLLDHPSADIRAIALRMAQQHEETDFTGKIIRLIDDEDQEVKVDAIRYICQRSEDKAGVLKAYLDSEDYRIQGAAIMCAAKHWKESKEFRDIGIKDILVAKFKDLQSKSEDDEVLTQFKINAAYAIGDAGDPELYPYLVAMFNSATPEVVRAAVSSAGRTGDMEFVPFLIRHLKTRTIRRFARQSLSLYGERVIDVLSEHLSNPIEDYTVRQQIPGVLAQIGSQKSVNALMKNLHAQETFDKVVRALNKLRGGYPDLNFDKSTVDKKIFESTRQYYRALTLLHGQSWEKSEAGSRKISGEARAKNLLVKALEERLDHDLEIIFRFLGLRYKPKEMYDAYLGIMSQRSSLRANAIEFLDNVLRPEFKKLIVPIIEMAPVETLLSMTKSEFGYTVPTEDESIEILLAGPDNWLRACALYLIAELHYDRYKKKVLELSSHPDQLIRETARFCLVRLGEAGWRN